MDVWKNYKVFVPLVSMLIIVFTYSQLSSGALRPYAVDVLNTTRHFYTWSMSTSDQERIYETTDLPEGTKGTFLVNLSSMKLPQFNRSFKNPCWYDRCNNSVIFRCFPYVYLAGFPKCGTTDLYFRLAAHPLIIQGKQKETNYFSRKFFKRKMTRCGSFLHVRFAQSFPRESMAIWKQGQDADTYPGITFDASPSLAYDNCYFRNISENHGYDFPRNGTADWIHKIDQDVKIILILRNPVKRTLSDYTMRSKGRGTALNFHKNVKKTIREIRKCLKAGGPGLGCITQEIEVNHRAGMYYYHLKSWFEKIPRKQFLILRFEDYVANLTNTLAKVFEFLKLPAVSQKGLAFIARSKPRNVAAYKNKFQMLPETRALLHDFYKPLNEKLAKLLGDDRFLWNEEPA